MTVFDLKRIISALPMEFDAARVYVECGDEFIEAMALAIVPADHATNTEARVSLVHGMSTPPTTCEPDPQMSTTHDIDAGRPGKDGAG